MLKKRSLQRRLSLFLIEKCYRNAGRKYIYKSEKRFIRLIRYKNNFKIEAAGRYLMEIVKEEEDALLSCVKRRNTEID